MKTLKERIAVELAALNGNPIERTRSRGGFATEWLPLPDADKQLFNWVDWHYRVAPLRKVRPWKWEEVPVGKAVVSLAKTQHICATRAVILSVTGPRSIGVASLPIQTPEEMLAFFAMEDGSPCGVVE